MAVRAITFDFWCTLFRDTNGAARQQIRVDAFASATAQPPERVREAIETAQSRLLRHHVDHHRTLGPADAVRMTAQALDVSLSTQVATALTCVFGSAILRHPPEPIEGALNAVRAAAAHRPVGLVSDSGMSPGSSLRQLLERQGFIEHVSAMAFSDEVGVAKPQAAMFETAARGLGVNPSELLHIGDLEPTDIEGARAIGAKAALFGGENPKYVGATQADHTFVTWPDFVGALPEIL